MNRSIACLLVLLAMVAGCGGEPRFDATDEATAKASVDRMTAGMTAAQKDEFTKSMTTVMVAPALKGGVPKDQSPNSLRKPLHGMTAAEITAKAESIRAELGTGPKTNP
jgi:hypothetical protein